MAISLTKGENINLDKALATVGGTLTSVTVGLGWEARTTDGKPFDLDASAIGVDANDKAPNIHWLVFYKNDTEGNFTVSPDGKIVYGGDNQTGDGDGDDETVKIDLANLSTEIDKVVIVVSIYDAVNRGQKFGQVKKAYVRIVDDASGQEIPGARFDLTEDYSTETALVFGELYRNNSEWKFRAVGQGYTSGLAGVMKDYGLAGSGG